MGDFGKLGGMLGGTLLGYIAIKELVKVPKGLAKWKHNDIKKMAKYDKTMFMRRIR